MEIKDLYQFIIYYNQTCDGKSSEQIVLRDSDDVSLLTDLPQNTVFIYCKKYNEQKGDFLPYKNYLIGEVLGFDDLKKEFLHCKNSETASFIKYLLSVQTQIEGKFCIFKNRNKICAYNISDAECEVLSESQLANGRVLVEKEVDYSDKDYLNLE